MRHPIKRVVTGMNTAGQSTVDFEDHCTNIMAVPGMEGAYITEIWVTDEMPVNNSGVEDRSTRPIRHDPTAEGTIFRVVEIPPEGHTAGEIDTEAAFKAMGSRNKPTAEDSAQHATMHYTDSIDYLMVISGEMYMLMEDGTEVLLQPGHCIVQRGTKHAWINRGEEPCVLAAILINANSVYES